MFKVTMQYEEGKRNAIVDALSRLSTKSEKEEKLNEKIK